MCICIERERESREKIGDAELRELKELKELKVIQVKKGKYQYTVKSENVYMINYI